MDKQARSVDVTELLGIPWSKMHCGAMAFHVLSELLGVDVREHDLWLNIEREDLSERLDEYLKEQGERWQRVGKNIEDIEGSLELGDVLHSLGAAEFGNNHLSVVVALDPVPVIISTRKHVGAFTQRASSVRGLFGVYRFIG